MDLAKTLGASWGAGSLQRYSSNKEQAKQWPLRPNRSEATPAGTVHFEWHLASLAEEEGSACQLRSWGSSQQTKCCGVVSPGVYLCPEVTAAHMETKAVTGSEFLCLVGISLQGGDPCRP